MIRPRRPVLLALTLALVLAGPGVVARGDELVLKTGARYEGKIVSEDATHYVIDTTELGPLRIPKADVLKVNTPKPDAEEKPADGSARPKKKTPKKADEPAPASGAAPAGSGNGTAGAAPGAPASKDDAAAAAAKAAAEAKLQEEKAALDANERLERRRKSSVRRRTDPGAEAAPTDSAAATPAAVAPAAPRVDRDPERTAISAASLASTVPGSPVIVFEPPRPFAAAPSGIMLGRRTFARFDQSGAATAMFTVTVGERTERLAIRLADVQRHVAARSEGSRVRVLEGVSEGDWLRLRLADGTTVSGRFVSVSEPIVKLRVPAAEGPPTTAEVDVGRVVQVDGLIGGHSIARSLADLQPGEPVGVVSWPDGAETVGRFVDRMEHHVRFDCDGDGEPDRLVAVDAPLADVRRVPPAWRDAVKSWRKDGVLRVRGFEQYPDARVERVISAKLAAVTAYAIALRTDEGSAIVPFDNLVACDQGTPADVEAATSHHEPAEMNLAVVPGMSAADAKAKAAEVPKGLSFVTDGRVVTHVYIAAPYERPVCGLEVGAKAEDALPQSDLFFGVEIQPTGDAERARELVSESVRGLRVTAYVDKRGIVDILEISRR